MLRRQKHAFSQSTTPFACTLFYPFHTGPGQEEITAGFFIQSWRWDPPKLSRKSPSFSQNNIENFSQRWIPKPQFWYPLLRFGSQHRIRKHLLSWFSGYAQLSLAFLQETRNFGYFPEVPVTKIRPQHQLRIKTLASEKQVLSEMPALWDYLTGFLYSKKGGAFDTYQRRGRYIPDTYQLRPGTTPQTPSRQDPSWHLPLLRFWQIRS